MATTTMTAPDWSISLQNAVNNSPVLFKTEADYTNKQLDTFYKSSEYQTLAKQGYSSGDYSALQTKINSIKTSSSASYNKVKVPTTVASSRGRALLTLAELGVGLIPAIYDYFAQKSPSATNLPVSNTVQNSSVSVSPETNKIDLASYVPEYSSNSSLISVLENSNVINVSMLGQIQNSVVDLTNSVDLQTVALVSSLYDMTNAIANIGSSVSDSSSYLNMINDTLVQIASKENIAPTDLVSVVSALSDIATATAQSGGNMTLNLDTSGLESAITSLKPSDELTNAELKHYEKSALVNEYLSTKQDFEVLPSVDGFSSVSVNATPLEAQTAKHLQDAHYRTAQNSFTYDEDDFDNSFDGLKLPNYHGISGGFDSFITRFNTSIMPTAFNFDSTVFDDLNLFEGVNI